MGIQKSEAAVTRDRVKPLRMKPRTAAKYLDTSYDTVLDLIHKGVFTIFDNGKRGIGRRIHIPTEEIEVYASGGELALAEFRAKKKRSARR